MNTASYEATKGAAHKNSRSQRKSRSISLGERTLLAGLWQEAPFARLPPDAPPELRDITQDIDNPSRLYVVHQANRRHGFQVLVDKYIEQLRNGCGSSVCSTPTCFSCRRRLAGKSPVRRYNPTSARTLAVYLASQDNPEFGLCPCLNRSREPSSAFHTLIFSSTSRSSSHQSYDRHTTRVLGVGGHEKLSKDSEAGHARKALDVTTQDEESTGQPKADTNAPTKPLESLRITEQSSSKDYRSFAANMFTTVTFKMIEWLSPQSVAAMAARSTVPAGSNPADGESSTIAQHSDAHRVSNTMEAPFNGNNAQGAPTEQQKAVRANAAPDDNMDSARKYQAGLSSSAVQDSTQIGTRGLPTLSSDTRTSSKATKRHGKPTEKKVPPGQKDTPVNRVVPDYPLKPGFFEKVRSQRVVDGAKQQKGSEEARPTCYTVSEAISEEEGGGGQISGQSANASNLPADASSDDHVLPEVQTFLPQSLRRLDVDIVEFLCRVLTEDCTLDQSITTHADANDSYLQPSPEQYLLERRHVNHRKFKKHWQAFTEQTIFHVLSDPQSLVLSFTQDGQLYDSHTLWYCMFRLMQVKPNLVLHSLWVAAGSLFAAPSCLRSLQLPKATWNTDNGSSDLSSFEAGAVMSICLHALVAVLPYVSDSRTLFEMSRIRANGYTLGGSGAATRQPSSVCLAYDDAFSNELALRLARRLFSAIVARFTFMEIHDSTRNGKEETQDMDVLKTLLGQLDLLGNSSPRIRDFSPAEKLLHETRVPTLLLDWAKTVLLKEWDGQPEFSNNGSFSGAISLMKSMYESRNDLLLGDIQFRVDYFSERLDSIEMPVTWLSFNSSMQKRHMLDYPFMFSPDTLVSYFRSINFARMSRMFEESSSLKTRMGAIVDPGSLITDPHHKVVLQDMLRTASSKYLVLEIGRNDPLRDAFDQLWRREERELLRPLKVHLGEEGGEEGFDSGGVQQEFFRMAIAECLDPKYGAFTVDERTRMAWFMPGSTVEDWKFQMIGLLVSLAVYNGLTLPITFPRALYRKLLGKAVQGLHHIADGWPELASGLTALLEWDESDGLIEDVFARTYEFSVSSLGQHVSIDMIKPNAVWPQRRDELSVHSNTTLEQSYGKEDAPLVTDENRDEYVTDYVRFLTDVSIQPQYMAFERGFLTCFDQKSLRLLSPHMLQSIVEGVQEIDVSELRRYTRYVGWDSSHHTIRDFWSIVKKYDDEMKRRLLEFVTASDRVPVGGLRNLQFVIQKNGIEEGGAGHLPTAYTCYGTLLLPEYADKDILKERLGMALENAQGFGFA